ncbi:MULTISPECIES: hypothetical protein [unclassified Sulfitobacter]|jgi:thioredoxin-related protein|uniref:hypothetical protein n=1 Tax=unclassified Sulfitobacter TaxID=196795 RepID=UPI0015932CF0|nr:hypothetical protein [Sulfitobacter sp. HGT1]MBQ0804278.1 hypothetical protein [Sulfitobacter sp.]
MSRIRAVLFAFLALATLSGQASAEASLIMAEEKGCMWCARWNDEIAPIYPKTEAGKTAPLRRIDIKADTPSDLTFARSLRFTPTFILVVDGQEISRIEGYPGEDFFWGVLEKIMYDNNLMMPPNGS